MADAAREADSADLTGGLGGDLLHPGVGLLLLLVMTALNVYKPRGMTRYAKGAYDITVVNAATPARLNQQRDVVP